MIPRSGNIKFRELLTDCGVSTMYGNGYLTQASIRDRTAGTTSGNVSMLALRGTCVSCHRNVNSSWNATNYNTGVANCAYYMNPGNLECDCGVNYLRLGASRQSDPDQWSECHYHGYSSGHTRFALDGKIKGFGSANDKGAPGQISVIAASTGFLSGALEVLWSIQYYGTFSDRPVSASLTVPVGKQYITVAHYQLLYGPNHQPSSDGQATYGKKYLTQFGDIRIRGI